MNSTLGYPDKSELVLELDALLFSAPYAAIAINHIVTGIAPQPK